MKDLYPFPIQLMLHLIEEAAAFEIIYIRRIRRRFRNDERMLPVSYQVKRKNRELVFFQGGKKCILVFSIEQLKAAVIHPNLPILQHAYNRIQFFLSPCTI